MADRLLFPQDDRPISVWAVGLVFGSDLHRSAEDPFRVLGFSPSSAWNFDSHVLKIVSDFRAATSQVVK